jgi:hypothetical protein
MLRQISGHRSGTDGVFGRQLPSSLAHNGVLRFRLLINVICSEAVTSIRWRSAA